MTQKSFDYQLAANYATEDWITAPSNAEATQFIMTSPEALTSPLLALYGAEGVGKTHLAHIWATQMDAQFIETDDFASLDSASLLGGKRYHVIEDIDSLTDAEAQESLFHLLNEVKLTGSTLLVTSSRHPTKLDILLADLTSRLAGFTAIGIGMPDEMLLEALIMKQFSDKQLKVSPDVVTYMLSRAGRSCAAIKKLVDKIDAQALTQKRNITVPFVREVMQGFIS